MPSRDAKQSERKIQRKILDYLKTVTKCWVIKIISCNQGGTPDILCCYKGNFYAIEVKKPGENPTPRQLEQIKRIAAADGATIIVTSVEEVRKIIV
jgi:Holliday junction resolvase